MTFAGTPADLEAAIGPLEPRTARWSSSSRPTTARRRSRSGPSGQQTFGRVPVGASLLMADSEGHLSLADNQGDAAGRLGLTLDRPVRIRPGLIAPMSDPGPSPLVEVDGLTFRYRRATEPAIRDVSLTVDAGEVLLVAGPSGCGKSTLIRAINGLIPHAYPGELSGDGPRSRAGRRPS